MTAVTLIPGDGIGPEIVDVVREIVYYLNVDIEWDIVNAGTEVMEEYGTPLPEMVLDSIRKNRIALKGPITTPVGSGFRSVNVEIRKRLGLYANLRPVSSLQGIKTRYEDVDLIIVRENTEGLYSGIEHLVGDEAAESIRIITRKASARIARFAFNYARENNRKLVTAVHKANILKLSDGLFLETVQAIAADYPDIEYNERIIDNMCMQLVMNPDNYDLLVLPNLYGDIISDLSAGFIGGLGLTPGVNYGDKIAVFEPVHGSAPDIAGKSMANPVAILRSLILLFKHIKEYDAALSLQQAIENSLLDKKDLTPDLGGKGTTNSLKNKIINNIY